MVHKNIADAEHASAKNEQIPMAAGRKSETVSTPPAEHEQRCGSNQKTIGDRKLRGDFTQLKGNDEPR